MDLATFNPDNATDADTIQAQTALKAAGYYKARVDDDFGPESREALDVYRRDHAAETVSAAPPGNLSATVQQIRACLDQYVGLIEIVDNAKWADPNDHSAARVAVAEKLRTSLIAVGCEPGWSYCISAAWVVRKEAYAKAGRAADFAKHEHLFSVSVLTSFNNFHAADLTTRTPSVGAILCLEHGQTGQGHAVTVTEVHDDSVVCVGFNTSPAAGDVAHERDGDGVYAGKVYPLDFTPRSSGLWPRGFIPVW